jgi:hypothetical protein
MLNENAAIILEIPKIQTTCEPIDRYCVENWRRTVGACNVGGIIKLVHMRCWLEEIIQ